MEISNTLQSTATPKPTSNNTARPENASASDAKTSASPQTSEESQTSPLPPVETTSDAGNSSAQIPTGESQTGNQVDLAV